MQDQKGADADSLVSPNREATSSFTPATASLDSSPSTLGSLAAGRKINAAALRAAAKRLPLLLAEARSTAPSQPATMEGAGSAEPRAEPAAQAIIPAEPLPMVSAEPLEEPPLAQSPSPPFPKTTASAQPRPAPVRRVAPKIYAWSLWFAALVVAVQGMALLSVFWLRHRIKGDTRAPALMPSAHLSHPSQDTPIPELLAPRSPVPSTQYDHRPPSLVLDPRPGGGRLAPPALTNSERVAALLQEAKRFNSEGDRELARAALSQAEDLEPQNPIVLERQGELAEEAKNVSRATDYWSRIVSMGPAAGTSYERARSRLEEAAQAEGTDSSEAAFRHQVKTPLQLLGVERRSGNGSPFGQELIFRFRIAADSRTKISLEQISYQFYAYDQIDAGIIVPTNAHVTVGFENAFPRWGRNRVEVLQVTYRLDHPVPHQRFYGYVFRLFYSGLLQSQRAEPPELLLRLPSAKGK
ncbi:MAG: hypothetical protein PHO89_10320 [Methylacidiphilaceae bacterium]|nr:hypothetical protein [Candidatus Methylacidiphilaceae bacterium]